MTCRHCPEPVVTKTRCVNHATAQAAAAREARLRQAKRGRCTECPKAPVFGRAYCQAHLDKKRDGMRRARGALAT
jgi:hypothetical protein